MAAPEPDPRDLARTVMAVLFILGLIAGCLWILTPFLTAIICAATIAIATWPMLNGIARRWGGRRGLAIAAMLTGFTIAFLAPVYFGTVAAVQSASAAAAWLHELPNRTLPSLPDWLAHLPVVGARLQQGWGDLTTGGGEGLRAKVSAHSDDILRWVLHRVGGLAGMLVQVLVTLGITGLLYLRGDRVAAGLLAFARRLAGSHGERAARLAALATRGVALGVVLTPLIQSILAGIGMATAGIPHFGLIAVGVLISCLAQAGPLPVLAIPVIWLFSRGATLPASGLAAWALVVHISGPIVRPLLIKKGVDLPLSLILSGVIGGVMAFGVVGLFIGPVLLAVAGTLLESWMTDETRTGAGPTSSPGESAREA